VVEEAEAQRAGEVVDHDVSEKRQPWKRRGRVERLLKSSTTSLKRIFH
jgi:translation initiation factor 2 alpha subunit (eIF-2alpha)